MTLHMNSVLCLKIAFASGVSLTISNLSPRFPGFSGRLSRLQSERSFSSLTSKFFPSILDGRQKCTEIGIVLQTTVPKRLAANSLVVDSTAIDMVNFRSIPFQTILWKSKMSGNRLNSNQNVRCSTCLVFDEYGYRKG